MVNKAKYVACLAIIFLLLPSVNAELMIDLQGNSCSLNAYPYSLWNEKRSNIYMNSAPGTLGQLKISTISASPEFLLFYNDNRDYMIWENTKRLRKLYFFDEYDSRQMTTKLTGFEYETAISFAEEFPRDFKENAKYIHMRYMQKKRPNDLAPPYSLFLAMGASQIKYPLMRPDLNPDVCIALKTASGDQDARSTFMHRVEKGELLELRRSPNAFKSLAGKIIPVLKQQMEISSSNALLATNAAEVLLAFSKGEDQEALDFVNAQIKNSPPSPEIMSCLRYLPPSKDLLLYALNDRKIPNANFAAQTICLNFKEKNGEDALLSMLVEIAMSMDKSSHSPPVEWIKALSLKHGKKALPKLVQLLCAKDPETRYDISSFMLKRGLKVPYSDSAVLHTYIRTNKDINYGTIDALSILTENGPELFEFMQKENLFQEKSLYMRGIVRLLKKQPEFTRDQFSSFVNSIEEDITAYAPIFLAASQNPQFRTIMMKKLTEQSYDTNEDTLEHLKEFVMTGKTHPDLSMSIFLEYQNPLPEPEKKKLFLSIPNHKETLVAEEYLPLLFEVLSSSKDTPKIHMQYMLLMENALKAGYQNADLERIYMENISDIATKAGAADRILIATKLRDFTICRASMRKEASRILFAMLLDPDEKAAKEAYSSLEAMGTELIPELETTLRGNDPYLAITACDLAGGMGTKARPLEKTIAGILEKSEDWTMREAAAYALSEIKGTDSIPLLEKALDDTSPQVRFAAAVALLILDGLKKGSPAYTKVLKIMTENKIDSIIAKPTSSPMQTPVTFERRLSDVTE